MVSENEAIEYNDNIVCFSFSDADKLDKIINKLEKVSGISGVYLGGSVEGQAVQCGTKMPLINEDTLVVGRIPEQLSNGQIITSYTSLFDNMAATALGKEYMAVGEKIKIGNIEFSNVAEINDPEGHIVSVDDFLALYREYGNDELIMTYVYNNGFTEEQMKKVEVMVTDIKKAKRVWQGIGKDGIELSFFLEMVKEHVFGVIIASINALFLYGYLLERRIQVYTILKLQGLTNGKLRAMLFAEFLAVYIAACVASAVVYGIYSLLSNNIWYHTGQVSVYSFGIVFVVNIILFFVMTWKLVRRQPFEIYQRK